MKALFTIALLLSAVGASAQNLNTPMPPPVDSFEVEPAGCIQNETTGSCVIQNRSEDTLYCTIGIAGKTQRGIQVGNSREVTINAGRFETVSVYVAQGDKLRSVAPSARCSKGFIR